MKINKIFASLLLILLFYCGFVGAINSAVNSENRIDRPWQDYGWERKHACLVDGKTPCYSDYHYTLEALNLSKIRTNNNAVNSKLTEALRNKRNADEKYDVVTERLSSFRRAAEADSVIGRCIAGALAGGGAGAVVGSIVPGVGTAAGAIVFGVAGCAGGMFLDLFGYGELESSVKDYNNNWKDTMNAALDALELSAQNATETVLYARMVYQDLKRTGLCERGYIWTAGEKCREMERAFTFVDSGAEETTYGKINLVRRNMRNLSTELESGPNSTLYYSTMILIWGDEKNDGVVKIFTELAEMGNESKEEAIRTYDELRENASRKKSEAEEGLYKIEEEELEKITEAVPISGSAMRSDIAEGTIAERAEEYEKTTESAEGHYESAESAYARKGDNYFLTATTEMQRAVDDYSSIGNADTIIADAEKVVEVRRGEAEEAIKAAENKIAKENLGNEAKSILDEARRKYDEASRASTLGAKYQLYIQATEIAKSVSGKSAEEEMLYNTLLAELKQLISDAERCAGISGAGWRAEIGYIESNKPPTAVQRLNEIKREIESAVRLRYASVEEKRTELNERLTAANADELLDEMRGAESGIVISGRINYLAVCGVKSLAEKYRDIEEALEADEEKRNAALANQLIVETSFLMGPVAIDAPTEVTYVVTIINPKSYGGEEIEVTVPLEGSFNFMYSNIVSNTSDILSVSTQGKTMKILFTSIAPFERKVISFEKSVLLATTRSKEIKAVGLGDGSARINEKVVFKLDVDGARIALPEGATNILIDGLEPSRPLSEGVHTLTNQRTVPNAYTETKSDASVTASSASATVSYFIKVKANIELNEVPVFADIGEERYVSNVQISCGRHRCTRENVLGTHTITLYDVQNGEEATVHISYTITDPPKYIEEELRKYANSEEPEIRQLAQETQRLLNEGRYEEAIKRLEDLKKKCAELEKEKSSLIKEYHDLMRRLTNELKDLNESIAKANQLGIANHTEVRKLQIRKEALESELSRLSISENATKNEIRFAIDELKKIDLNWLKGEVSAVSRQAKKEFESLKKEFAEYDNENASSALKQLEDDINVLLATEKATDMITVLADLDNLNKMKDSLISQRQAELQEMRAQLEEVRESVEKVLQKYEREHKDAKGLGMESLFPIQPNSVRNLLSETERLLEKGDMRSAKNKIEKEIPTAVKKMEETLRLLSTNAYRKLDEIDEHLSARRPELSGEQISEIESKKRNVESLAAAGNYVKAISEGTKLIDYINSIKGKGNMALYLIIASILLAALVVIYMTQQKKKKPQIKILEKNERDKG
ncbi:MAG: hypothetical protein QXT05_01960 [Candidatus Bilamarchaeaceae archaeon]